MTSYRVALVTGGTGAIGKAIAQRIAQAPEYQVVLGCRDHARATAAAASIRQATGNDRVSFELVDLASPVSIRALAERWRGPLHVLVNNAAVTPRRRQETTDGVELQFATNVLGYLRLTQALLPALGEADGARVVNVASYWAGDLDLDDLEFRRRPYTNGAAYRQSKQANRMLTVALAERLSEQGINVNACHPGDVNSTLSNNLGFGGHETPDQGALTPAWLATASQAANANGRYFEHLREVRCRFGEQRDAVEALYQRCLDYA